MLIWFSICFLTPLEVNWKFSLICGINTLYLKINYKQVVTSVYKSALKFQKNLYKFLLENINGKIYYTKLNL